MDYQAFAPATINLVSMGLVAGSTNTLTSTVTSNCSIDGKFTTAKTAMTNSSFSNEGITTDAGTAAAFIPLTSTSTSGTACVLLFGINDAGAVKVAQGQIVPTSLGVTTTPGAFISAPPFPAVPDDFCPVAYTIVRTSPTVPTFTIGSSSWANNSTTFRNICTIPDRPQLA